ncbi:MAG: PRC-barrel domain-containing protein [Opitutales bacterium]|nr:PRC-barrel domain-containing protein [Opitutales bacterium]
MNRNKIISLAGIAALLVSAPVAFAYDSDRDQTAEDTRERWQERGEEHFGSPSADVWSSLQSSSELLGADIMSADDEKIGEIDEVFIHLQSGEILGIVVSTGGFLGMGGHRSLLSPENIRMDGDGEVLRADLSREEIRSAPRYRRGGTTGFDRLQWQGEDRGTNPDMDRTNQQRNPRPDGANLGGGDNPQGSEREEVRRERSGGMQMALALSDLEGMDIVNRDDDAIGSVERVYLNLEDGKAVGAVVSTGGFLGMGAHKSLLAVNEVRYDEEKDVLRADLDRDALRDAPEYTDDDPSVFEHLRDRWDEFRGEQENDDGEEKVRSEARERDR